MKAEPTQQNLRPTKQGEKLRVSRPRSYSRAAPKAHFSALMQITPTDSLASESQKYLLTDRKMHLCCIKGSNNFLSVVLYKVGEIFISQMTQRLRYFVILFVYICPSHKLEGVVVDFSWRSSYAVIFFRSLIKKVMEFLKVLKCRVRPGVCWNCRIPVYLTIQISFL